MLSTIQTRVPVKQDSVVSSSRGGPAWDWLAVLGMAALWSLVVGYLAVQRHLAFRTEFDVAVYSHVIWTTTQGRPFYNSLVEGITNYLGHHFVPLMLVYVPLYSVWPDPRMLITAQTAVLASGALPLYAFAKRQLRRQRPDRAGTRLAITVVAAYLLSPLLAYVAFADLHEIALAVPLLMGAGAALLSRRLRAAIIWLALALLTKEEIVIIAVGFGLYAMFIQRRWLAGAAIAAGAAVWGVVLFRVLMPAFSGGGGDIGFLWRYRALGDTPGEIARALLTRPGAVVALMAGAPKLTFIWQLLAPLGGLPLLGWPAAFLILPPLAYLLLSDYAFQATIWYHYTAPLIPFLFLATVVALRRLGEIGQTESVHGKGPTRRGRRLAALGGVLLISATLLAGWRWSPLPGGHLYKPSEFQVTEEARATRALLAEIPPQAAVAADAYVQPWLANRWLLGDIDVLPLQQFPGRTPDYVVERAAAPYAVDPPLYPWLTADRGENPLRIPRFEPVGSTPGGMTLYKRRGPEYDVLLTRYDAPFEQGLTLTAAGLPPEAPKWGEVIRASPGITLPIWMAWTAEPLHDEAGTSPDRRITFSLHLVDGENRLVAQTDAEMGSGRFPTTLWHTWSDKPTLAGEFPLVLPENMQPGRYYLLAGAYETEGVKPLAQPAGVRPALANMPGWVPLSVIEVQP